MNDPNLTSTDQWDATRYETQHSFVWEYASDLIEILAPQAGEYILDLGCGTGQLTAQIAAQGAIAIGIDKSPTMIATASKNYPNLQFLVADGADFSFDYPFDGVFSNAALHWMTKPEAVIKCIGQALKPGGRFVAEFGGKGNIKQISRAVETVLKTEGYPIESLLNPWYFPSIGEYATLLENEGFDVTFGVLFDRPTPLEAEQEGMKNWIKMFGNHWLSLIPESEQPAIFSKIEAALRPYLYGENHWIADYRRLRIVAQKI
ncbi:Methyltransferase type 11 [Gloeothece citriformis PCC 7424]|uniref:Methyltransferase type 11 n=1 Tax=Gloeothece citriformis (strain PCC 7424) TaxID=65393 RepID=B7KGA5_GLOC7|nr:class I SAM-dependent methyltransferase [Gloeothece citriformis]ACK70576.1 Methyltransferase type 11 [Gloeothece citriformis PCC 7424]